MEATADLIAVGCHVERQLDAGLTGLLQLLGADRGDAGFVGSVADPYRPARMAAMPDVATEPFEVAAGDPLVVAVMSTPEPMLVADVCADLTDGPVRDLLVGNGTRSILVRRLERHDDGCGLVCIDWTDRVPDVPTEALELVDYFVSRIWSPMLMRSVTERSPVAGGGVLAQLSAAERSVVELAATGLSYAEIAGRRQTSTNTVSQQLRSARAKTGARNTAELCGLLGHEPPAA